MYSNHWLSDRAPFLGDANSWSNKLEENCHVQKQACNCVNTVRGLNVNCYECEHSTHCPTHDGTILPLDFFPTLGNETKKKGKEMADKYRLTIKNGRNEYKYDKHGNYSPRTVDSVQDYDTLAEALAEFLYTITDEYEAKNKTSLTFIPGKGKK